MKKKDLIEQIWQELKAPEDLYKKDIRQVVDTLFSTMVEHLVAGEDIQIVGLGRLTRSVERNRGFAGSEGPSEKYVIRFKSSRTLRNQLRQLSYRQLATPGDTQK